MATEPGTRAGLKGPFFKDWWGSIKGYSGWQEGDPAMVNYVGHPMMGAVTGFIELGGKEPWIRHDRGGVWYNQP